MTWTVLMGPSGGVLNSYDSYSDIKFQDNLYDYGAAKIALTGLDGHAAPQPGWIVKLVWDYGLSSQQVHWQGFISSAEKRQQGNVYAIRAYTLDCLLAINQTGAIRNYVTQKPYSIMQGGLGPPADLLHNAQGNLVMPYGSSGTVPNQVDTVGTGNGHQGVQLAQFVADSTTLFNNMRRLCNQSRYTVNGGSDGSYGLEWTTTLEGANASTPTFYLVKRRESRFSYTPETWLIPDDFHRSRRGASTLPGLDTVKVIGGGDGNSRIESTITGGGSREATIMDKAILQQVNADNFANRILQIYSSGIEVIAGEAIRHNSPTRAGDTVTVTQNGGSITTRVMQRYYDLAVKGFVFMLGRPEQNSRDNFLSSLGIQGTDTTSPQYTDLRVHSLFPSGVNLFFLPFGGASPTNVAAGATVAGAAATPPAGWDGDMEGFFTTMQLVVDAGHTPRNGGTAEILIQFDFATSPGVYQTIFVQSFGEPGVGTGNPVQDTNQTYNSYPYKVNAPFFGDTAVLTGRIAVRNRGNANLAIDGINTSAAVYRTPKHRHNEL